MDSKHGNNGLQAWQPMDICEAQWTAGMARCQDCNWQWPKWRLERAGDYSHRPEEGHRCVTFCALDCQRQRYCAPLTDRAEKDVLLGLMAAAATAAERAECEK